MIVIEGMDNSGKTTLMQTLVDEVGIAKPFAPTPIHSPGPDVPEVMAKRMNDFFDYTLAAPIIFDRIHCISDQVYSKVLGRPNYFDQHPHCPECYRAWRTFLMARPVIIYCRPPLDVISFSLRQRAQMNGVNDKWFELVQEYDRFMFFLENIPEINLLYYDYTGTFNREGVNRYQELDDIIYWVNNRLYDEQDYSIDGFNDMVQDLESKGWSHCHLDGKGTAYHFKQKAGVP